MNFKRNFSVCISSVIEKEENFLDYRFTAKSVIQRLGMEGIRNPEDIRTQNNFENELRENCELFVLILGAATSDMVERELKIALARGIPILVFVKISRDLFGAKLFPDNVNQNFARISPELYNAQIITFENCEELDNLLELELQDHILKKISLSPLIGLDPPVAYTEGVKLIRDAKYRIVLSQTSSILVLGPRKGNNIEKVFYEELLHWLYTEREQSTFFVHYFSIEDTRRAMMTGEYFLKEARVNFEELIQRFDRKSQFIIRVTNNMEIVSHLIADTGLGLNFWIGSNRYYLFLPCFMTKDSELQSIITSVQRIGKSFTKKEISDLYNCRLPMPIK